MKSTINVRLDLPDFEKIRQLANDIYLRPGQFVRALIKEYLKDKIKIKVQTETVDMFAKDSAEKTRKEK
jgi:hypothetical protein